MKLIKKLTNYTTPLSLGVVFSTCMIGCGPYRSGQRLLPTPQQLGGGLAHTVNVNPEQVTDEMLNSVFNFTKTATSTSIQNCGHFLYNVLTDLRKGNSAAIHRVYDDGIISDAISGNLTTLHIAVLIGNINIIKLLLEHGVNRDAKDKKAGFTALMFTIGDQNDHDSNIAQLLLQHGANPNATNNNGKTALRLAAHHKHLGVFKVLIDHGVDVVANITDNNYKNMVKMVVRSRRLQVITRLIRQGPKMIKQGNEILELVIFCIGRARIHGDHELGKMFFEEPRKFRQVLPGEETAPNSYTTAGGAMHGNTASSTAMLQGLSPDQISELARRTASHNQTPPLTQNVLQGGLNANPTDLLIPAIINGNIQKVQELLDQGANPNVPDKDGNLPLAIAIKTTHRDLHIVSLLLNHGADPSSSYAILNAVYAQWTALVHFLISNSVNIPDDQYKQAFNMAIEAGNLEIAHVLLKKVVTPLASTFMQRNIVNSSFQDLSTKLEQDILSEHILVAIYQGEVDKVRTLLQLGANPNTIDRHSGQTLLMIAGKYEEGPTKQTLIDILLRVGAIRK